MNIIILAAGISRRMRSQKPKLLHLLAGQPIIVHVVQTVSKINAEQTVIVCGKNRKELQSLITNDSIDWVEQEKPTGTGSAAQIGLTKIKKDQRTIILCGDMPLIHPSTLERMMVTQQVEEADLVLLTEHIENPTNYGRIVRDTSGHVREIIEEKDATAQQKTITEINCGVYCATSSHLRSWVQRLKKRNQQGEYYLTDIVKEAFEEKRKIVTITPTDHREIHGINDAEQLERTERNLQEMRAEKLLSQGIRLADRTRIDIRGQLQCEEDVFIDVNCIFSGVVHLGRGVQIGPHCWIKDTIIKDHAVVLAHCVIEGGWIDEKVTIGPFARIRPETTVHASSKIGNFVEIKNSTIGAGSKINHLSYIGDATLCKEVLIGAGTITCNFDGQTKHTTFIDERSFIGSGSQLIAPLSIGRDAVVGAGSTITKDVPSETLSLTRSPQKSFPQKKRRNQKKEEAK